MDEIIVFGRGRYFREKEIALFSYYSVKEIWDNAVGKGNRDSYHGIPVINPSDAELDGGEHIFLFAVSFIGMWMQLVRLGVDPERLVVPYNLPYEFENDSVLRNCVKDIAFGKEDMVVTDIKGKGYKVKNDAQWRELLRIFYKESNPVIKAIASMSTTPVSLQFGTERGTPVDRFYIDKFLSLNEQYIKGNVLEIEDNTYTLKYGDKDCRSLVMDVSSDSDKVDFLANLETGEGIRDGIADCFICTQTLMYIYDTPSVARNIYKLLNKNGIALITCSGLSQNSRRCMDDYGCTFNYNVDAFRHMFADKEKFEILDIGSYGNVKTVCAHLAGLCGEDLKEEDFEVNDKYYPLVVYAVIKRVD